MAHSRTIATLTELNSREFPVLRLRQPKASAYRATKSSYEKFKQLFYQSADEVNGSIEQSADPETTKRNKEKLRQKFEAMKRDIDKMEKETMDQMDDLTPEQQEEVLTFWSVVSEWMAKALNWLKAVYDKVLEKIKEGYRIVKQALTDAFQFIIDAMKDIF